MKLLFSSDLHGLEPGYRDFASGLKEGGFDVGVLAGDLMTYPSEAAVESAAAEIRQSDASGSVPEGEAARRAVQLALERMESSLKGILRGSGKPVVFVMGNDDGILGDGRAWKSEGQIVDIHFRRARYGRYRLVGYHYTTPFVGGTFERTEEDQEQDFARLERLVDDRTVLVTHGPPRGILDTAGDGEHVGSMALRRLVERARPRMHLFGHIHRTFGIDGARVNGSYPSSRKFIGVDVDRGVAWILPE